MSDSRFLDMLKKSVTYDDEDTIFIATVIEVIEDGESVTVQKLDDPEGLYTYGCKLTIDDDTNNNILIPKEDSKVIVEKIKNDHYITFIQEIDKIFLISYKDIEIVSNDNIKIESDQINISNQLESLKGLLEDVLDNQNDLAGAVDDLNTQVAAITTQVAGAPVGINNATDVTTLAANYKLIQTESDNIKTRLGDLLSD